MVNVRLVDAPTEVLFRIGYLPTPLAWPAWEHVGAHRFDDPQRRFRTLYLAEQRRTCFLETLAAFRLKPELIAAMRAVAGTGEPLPIVGTISRSWLARRGVGLLRLAQGQRWVDMRALESRETLRVELAETLARLGLADLDVSGVCGPERQLTKAIARWAYEHGYAGIVYHSRLGLEYSCWAVFEGANFDTVEACQIIRDDDPDLLAVATVFHLVVR